MTPHPDCPSTARHGTLVARGWDNCRCPEVVAAHAAYEKRRTYDLAQGRRRTVPAFGTVRRLRALYAAGWTSAAVAAELGVCRSRVGHLALADGRIAVAVAGRVDAVYRDLSGRAGPSSVTAARAARLGYAPPIAWDDDAIDDPAGLPWAVIDDHGNLTHRVGGLAVRRCARAGCTWWAAGAARHCSARCVRVLLESEERRARRRESWRATAVRKRARARQVAA